MSRTNGADDVARFVERFALLLVDAGWPRMPARVFSFVLAVDQPRLTARQLADGLRVSPAAVSGAVRYLVQIGMLLREREPGARIDHHGLPDSVWIDVFEERSRQLQVWSDALTDGANVVGRDGPAGRRLLDTAEFFSFMHIEVRQMVHHWQDRTRREAAPR